MSPLPLDPQEWVIYQPPKSVSFGHQSRLRDPRRAWPLTREFLAAQDSCELGHHFQLTCCEPSPWTEAAVAEARVEEAQRRFGPSGGDRVWSLGLAQLEEAVAFVLDDDKYPQQKFGPVIVSFHCQFIWPNFAPRISQTGDPRKRECFLGVRFGHRKLFLQPTLVFPAPWTSDLVREYITRLEPKLPFRIRNQYFKRWLPAKSAKAKWGQFLNLDRDWRERLSAVG